MFALSFLLDAFLADHRFFGARTVIVTSASSKASLGIARLLAGRGVDVTAVTSPRNVSFVAKVGVYARTVTYDQVPSLPQASAVLVDVAGDVAIRRAIHEHFGDQLAYSTIVGATHRYTPADRTEVPGPAPASFFAPDHMRQRIGSWGANEFDRRFGTSLRDFALWTRGWLTINSSVGAAAVRSTYLSVLDGATNPAESHILAMTP